MNMLNQLSNFLKPIGVDYAICGGSAIDLFLGKKTRTHKDLDVAVYWEERDIIIQHMLDSNWGIYEPCGGEYFHKINDITEQKQIKSNIWCIKPGNSHYSIFEFEDNMFKIDFDGAEQTQLDYIEFLFNNRKDDFFLYARNKDIKLEMNVSRGFKSCKKYNVCLENETYPSAMLVKELIPDVLDGRKWVYRQSPVFEGIDEQEVELFDKGFESMEKKHLPCQEEFYIHSSSFIQ